MNRYRSAAVGMAAALVMGLFAGASAQESKLGTVIFPVTGSKEAQTHFMRGLAALHSFWYEEALEAFRESTRVEPGFAMGYWGEAMAHNHPLWSEQDFKAGLAALEKIKDTSKLTDRERAFINAVRVLYGDGDKLVRDIAYSGEMEKIHEAYPDDLEAAAFYSLSLLGMVRPGDKGFTRQMKAGALALDIFEKNPKHPGAAHYIIHSFDDPEHAILALPAARLYAEIAPDAHHARHMPSHIFLQLGMWPEAASSNEAAWRVSDEWVKRKGLSITLRDYHSLHWLLYVYLQQGRFSDAERLMDVMKKSLAEAKDDRQMRPGYLSNNYANMASVFVVETERWSLAKTIYDAAGSGENDAGGEHAMHGAMSQGATVRRSNLRETLPAFVQALAAARTGSPNADELAGKLGQSGGSGEYRPGSAGIRTLMAKASALAAKNDHDGAIETMKKAVALEEEMSPPSGPPGVIKPSHEMMGEILLKAGRPKEASGYFATSLARQPNRARSLLGAARASAGSGDTTAAAAAYSRLVKQWAKADKGLPELREAEEYLKAK